MLRQETWKYNHTEFPFYQSSSDPKLLITAGFHGDETDVVEPLTQIILANAEKLPPFLYIPIASPSAAAARTRLNGHKVDVNRMYRLDSSDPEAKALMQLLIDYSFDIAYSFHEHPGESRFYLYDMGEGINQEQIDLLKARIKELGVELFSGIDDLEDPALGGEIADGYSLEREEDAVRNGFFNGFLLQADIAKRHLNPEIPGAVPLEKKAEIVQVIFETLIYQQSRDLEIEKEDAKQYLP